MSDAPQTFRWTLGELPSTQHRAGLAGLVLFLRWAAGQREQRGTCRLVAVDADSATVELDPNGLAWLFDHLYAATIHVRTPKPKTTKELIPLPSEDGLEEADEYDVIVPRGGPIVDWDPIGLEAPGYANLWRNMLWNVPRARSTQRLPYTSRASGTSTKDGATAWRSLTGSRPVTLASTLFFGAEAATAETVPFMDLGRFEFLLHFQPYALQTYVPAVLDRNRNDGTTKHAGFALVIPDVCVLDAFCEELPKLLLQRDRTLRGKRPRAAEVDLALSAAIDLQWALNERLALAAGGQRTADLVAGCDVLLFQKAGDNLRLRGSWRVEPNTERDRKHRHLRESLVSPLFRRQRLENLVYCRRWFAHFDRLLTIFPTKLTLDDTAFRDDARWSFTQVESELMSSDASDASEISVLVYELVGRYLAGQLRRKHGESAVKSMPPEEFKQLNRKVARDAFLAIRGRTGADFVEYFVGTLCSVEQDLARPAFLVIATALSNPSSRDNVRTLTLLALSARS